MAYDSVSLGNIQAHAIKRVEKDEVCFDVSLKMKNVDKQNAQPSNWSFAWVDKAEQYHLMSATQRDPAAVPKGGEVVAPYGAYQEWTNSFVTCAPKAKFSDVKSLVMTPKDLPYKEVKSLVLTWK